MIKKDKLGNYIDVFRGASLSSEYYSDSGNYIRLTLGNFNYPNGGFKHNIAKDDIYFNGSVNSKFILNKNDIITPLTEQVAGLLGEVARIPESNKYIQSGDIGLVIPKNNIDNSYAYYLTSSDFVKKQLCAGSQQTKIRHTSPEKIKKCTVYVSDDIKYQKKAGRLLDILNDKISTNVSIINEINNYISNLYNYWFIQYEFPDDNGLPYKSSGGDIIYSKIMKRNIPSGWNVENLYNNKITEIIKSGVDMFVSKNYMPTANINIENISDGNNVTYENRESRANMQPSINSVWFAKMKNSIKHITIPSNGQWFVDKYILSTGMYGVKCSEINLPYFSSFICSDYFEKVKNKLSHGATQESVNDNDLKRVKFLIPDNKTLLKFYKKTNKLLLTKFDLIKENQNLENIRDLLAPLLLREQVKFCNE